MEESAHLLGGGPRPLRLACLPPRDAEGVLDSIKLAGEQVAALLLDSQPSLALGDLLFYFRQLGYHHLRWTRQLVPHHPAQLGLVALEAGQGLLHFLACLLLDIPVELQRMELCLQLAGGGAETRILSKRQHNAALLSSQQDCLGSRVQDEHERFPVRTRPVITAPRQVMHYPVVELAAVPQAPQRRGEAERKLLVPRMLEVLAELEQEERVEVLLPASVPVEVRSASL